MKKCKCGMPIYDEPGQRYDKCYFCMVNSLRTAVEKRLFTGMNLKDKPKVYSGESQEAILILEALHEFDKKDKPNVIGNSEL